jgi:uncharacterized protein
MRRSLKVLNFPILLVAILAGVTTYEIIDNNRFVVIRQEITIPDLPQQFDGYTILQISDLHSQRFDEKQIGLTSVINSLNYDMIAITGDMQDHYGDLDPLLELLQGIQHKDTVVFTAGNSGPADVDFSTGLIIDEGKILQSAGCRLLDRPFSIERDGARLWFAELLYNREPRELERLGALAGRKGKTIDPEVSAALRVAYRNEINGIFAGISPIEPLIGITHFPLPKSDLDDPNHAGMRPYDLVVAGHYHGGQIRIPLLGVFYVPNASEKMRGFFPDQRIVSGLYEGTGMQQYTSRGLGAGGPFPFLRFRLFNTPEINLLTLRAPRK